jgi:manganese/zinc/iron transport system substrate-binding protein
VRVVCTTTIVADLVQQVGGERVQVETLMGPGVDPHKYIAGIGDIRKLQSAQAVFIHGLHLEGKMADLLERNRQQWRVHAVTDPLPREQLLPAEEDAAVYDPHVWFDVLLWAQTVEGVRRVLCEMDPQGEAYYAQRAAAYREQLQQLDREVRQELARVPPARRVLITAHDAFRYFGRAYGWEVIGLQGVSTASEVGTQQRERLARLIVERAIPAVFTETSVPPEGLQAVLDDVRRKQGPLVRLISDQDALYSDALGPADSPAGTYVGMIRHNVRVLVRALGPG